jgi:hypothetical protein
MTDNPMAPAGKLQWLPVGESSQALHGIKPFVKRGMHGSACCLVTSFGIAECPVRVFELYRRERWPET